MATKGLSHNFSLKNGKFFLTGGSKKAGDGIRFFLAFDTVARIYYPDFYPKLLWLIQKPGSTIDTYKTLVLGRLKKALIQFIPSIKVDGVNFQQFRHRGDKFLEITVDYTYNNEKETQQVVTFI